MGKSIEVSLYNKCHKIYLLSSPFWIFCFHHPNHLLLGGSNNGIFLITQRFHAAPVKQIKIFAGILTVYFNCMYFA